MRAFIIGQTFEALVEDPLFTLQQMFLIKLSMVKLSDPEPLLTLLPVFTSPYHRGWDGPSRGSPSRM